MGLCSDISWRRLEDRRVRREEAAAANRTAAERLRSQLTDVSRAYADRAAGAPASMISGEPAD